VSEHPAEPVAETSNELKGSEAAASDTPAEPKLSTPAEIEAPKLVPEQGEDAAKETPKTAPRSAGNITILAPSRGQSWDRSSMNDEADADASAKASGVFGKPRLTAVAAVIALAALAGAIGGALATAGIDHLRSDGGASSIQAKLFDDQIARISGDLAALKTDLEHTAKLSVTQIAKTTDRLDRVEKAQAEPAAKIAKLSEAVEKLRAAPPATAPVAALPAPAKDVTGSIAAPTVPATAVAATPAAPQAEVKRLPTVEGWVLRDVSGGVAVIESRRGIFEVYAGDPVPGLGRVDAIRRQDGRWVVVTSRGLIVAR
jgi:hypothetical protein